MSCYRNTTVNNMGPSNTTMMLQKATKCPPNNLVVLQNNMTIRTSSDLTP